MKLNGSKNIILDKDITITGGNSGDSLSNILDKHRTEISQLKSNVKWLYKYGGVGSGSGGTSSKWSIVASLGGKTIKGDTISLDPEVSNYILDIRISGAASSFYVEYTCGTISRTITLSADNGWRERIAVTLDDNGHVYVAASDGSVVETVEAEYITKPYTFTDIKFYKKGLELTWNSLTNDIFMESAAIEGLVFGCDYSFAINAETKYLWEFNGKTVEGTITDKTGIITLPVDSELFVGDSAGLYNVKLNIFLTPEGQTEQVITKSTFFNLIPAYLYLKLSPAGSDEMIYSEDEYNYYIENESENPYVYSVNRTFGINCKAYKGVNENLSCVISYITESLSEDGDEVLQDTLNGFQNQTYLFKLKFSTPGWHKITFTCVMNSETTTFIKYVCCYKSDSKYTWYKMINNVLASSGAEISASTYYRVSDKQISSGFGLNKDVLMNSSSKTFVVPTTPNLLECSQFAVNIGIQYNKINNIQNPVLTLNTSSGGITLYQNKVVVSSPYYIGEHTCDIYMPKSNDFDESESKKYHLVTLTYTTANIVDSEIRYQFCIYIDGILSGAFSEFGTGSQVFNSVTFNPGNYAVNLLDITYFSSNNCAINDVDVNYYYTSYILTKDNIEVNELDDKILNAFYNGNLIGSKYSIENNLLKLNSPIYNDICESVSIPTIVFKRDRKISELQTNVFDWMNNAYSQDSTSNLANAKINVDVYWSSGTKKLEQVNIKEATSLDSPNFYIQLQGSSTMGNKSKNFSFGVTTKEESKKLLFSPNYDVDDTSTFLPEQLFTLKADVVDSSHSNNTALGKFINDNNEFTYLPQSNSHVKQCLEGFPILAFLELTDVTNQYSTEYYYLGIYNFNLGRESYHNLGYCDLNMIENEYKKVNNFVFTEVDNINPKQEFIAAEIQGNSPYWDFSQFDQTILFPKDENDFSGHYMFGDIVRNSNNIHYKENIQNFVKSVAYGGGYLFSKLEKNFIPIAENADAAYRLTNSVPDVKTQYSRKGASYDEYEQQEIIDSETINNENNIYKCIADYIGDEENTPTLNYESAVYYYTTCMTFGLVDSVQKNLNIKTWDGKTFGLFFYDMDTSLGTSNSGGDTSYFCFSDYWNNKTTIDEDGNTILTGVTVERDYYPREDNGIIGYDVPSSYLFAISKYASSVLNDKNYLTPHTCYAKWRKLRTDGDGENVGVLENADKFIDKYYATTLKNIPGCLLNLNYRNKYLYNLSGDTFPTESIGLKGTKIEKTKEWLSGRLHILDAYFNLSGNTLAIGDTIYQEPIPLVSNLNTNKDIYILKDIFLNSGEATKVLTREGNCSFKVSGDAYAPLIVTKAGKISRYLLVDPNTKYTINESFVGQESSNFGGSDLWTYLESINPFIDTLANKTNFYLNSEKIESIEGNSNSSLSGRWNLSTPAAKTICLNGPNYAGGLNIDESNVNLHTLDISNSKISLVLDHPFVESLDASYVKSDKLTITNCTNLQKVDVSDAEITYVTIAPVWDDDVTFNNLKFVNLDIRGKNESGILTINGSNTLKTLTFSNFKKVVVKNCTNLTTVICNDIDGVVSELTITNSPILETLSVNGGSLEKLDLTGCTNLETFAIRGSDEYDEYPNLQFLDLQNTNVHKISFDNETASEDILDLTKFTNLSTNVNKNNSYFRIQNNSKVKFIRVSNIENTPIYIHYNLQGCVNLERIYGNILLNCSQCFSNNSLFSIHGADLANVTWKGKKVLDENAVVQTPWGLLGKNCSETTIEELFVEGDTVTNLSTYISDAQSNFRGTNCTIFDYYYFFCNCRNITNCSSTFMFPRNVAYGIFSKNNVPDRNLFYHNTKLISLSLCFYITQRDYEIVLWSPKQGSEPDNGLFSPLKNIENLSGVFLGYRYYADRFVFTRYDGQKYSIKNLSYFTPKLIVDDINTFYESWCNMEDLLDVVTWVKEYRENLGNISNFFVDLPSITLINGFLQNTGYLNYDTLYNESDGSIFQIPAGVTFLAKCFISTYGCGTILVKKYFANPSKVIDILGSFRVENILTIGDEDIYATMDLENSSFEGFASIQRIGYGTCSYSDFSTTSYTQSSFNGNGIKKQIVGDEFPYNIFINTGSSNITDLNAVFMNATATNALTGIKLPRNMFSTCPKLKSVSALFYNMKIKYELSNSVDYTNFKNCTELSDVSYMFGQETLEETPYLSGMIPKKFFYHGDNTKTIPAYVGADYVEYVYDDKGNIVYDENGYPTYVVEGYSEVGAITHTIPKATITDMKYCFRHSNVGDYINEYDENDLESNPAYSPYNWIYNSVLHIWEKNTKVDTNKQTYIWAFDGNNVPTDCDSIEILDLLENKDVGIVDKKESGEESPVVSAQYIAPPDLLRFCAPDANISGLFAYSGVSGWTENYSVGHAKKYDYGLTGRICSYMLKPVYNTTNIKELFCCCKKLSYLEDDGRAYMIPKDFFTYAPKINTLERAFSDMLFPSNIDVQVFSPLTSILNVREIFYQSYWDGTSDTPVIISNVFSTKRVSSTTRAFCIVDATGVTQTDRITEQYVTFNNVFNKIYASGYDGNENYMSTFRGYDENTVKHEVEKTLSMAEVNHNYEFTNRN